MRQLNELLDHLSHSQLIFTYLLHEVLKSLLHLPFVVERIRLAQLIYIMLDILEVPLNL